MATATYDRAQVAQQWGAYFQKRLDALEAAKALGMPWGWPEGTTWEQAALDLEAFFRQRPAVGTMLQVWPQAEQIMARPQETWTPDERRIVQAWTEPAIEHYMAQNPNVERVLAPHRQAGESWMDLMGREPEIGRALGQVWSGGQASGQAGLEGLSEEDLDPYDAEGMAQTLNRERRAFRQEMTAAQQEIAALEQHADAQAHFQKTLQDINDFERQVIYAPNSAHAATYQRDQLAAAMRDHHELNPWKAWEIDNAPKAREQGIAEGRQQAQTEMAAEGRTRGPISKSYERRSETLRRQQEAEGQRSGESRQPFAMTFSKPTRPRSTEEAWRSAQGKLAARGLSEAPEPMAGDALKAAYQSYRQGERPTSGAPQSHPTEALPVMPASGSGESSGQGGQTP